jgi:hypothetical protein
MEVRLAEERPVENRLAVQGFGRLRAAFRLQERS